MRILCLLALLCFGCLGRNKHEVRDATVVSASLGIMTPFAIPCHLLDTLLPSALETKNVETNDLRQLEDLLADTVRALNTSIDVRGKLIVTHQDSMRQTLCFDRFGVFYDGTNYMKNETLLNFLKAKKLVTP